MAWGCHFLVTMGQRQFGGLGEPDHTTRGNSRVEEHYRIFDNTARRDGARGKKVTDPTTQFWESVVQDEQLVQLTTHLQEAEGKMEKLKTTMRAMPPMV